MFAKLRNKTKIKFSWIEGAHKTLLSIKFEFSIIELVKSVWVIGIPLPSPMITSSVSPYSEQMDRFWRSIGSNVVWSSRVYYPIGIVSWQSSSNEICLWCEIGKWEWHINPSSMSNLVTQLTNKMVLSRIEWIMPLWWLGNKFPCWFLFPW